jgi:GxxExxY protein
MNTGLNTDLTERIIGCAIAVHRLLGPGLGESTYEEALCIELVDAGLAFTRQVGIPVTYKGRLIGEHRPDLVVDERVVVEIKSVERLIGLHQAQTLAYMRILELRTGLLINFNSEVIRTNVKRLAL